MEKAGIMAKKNIRRNDQVLTPPRLLEGHAAFKKRLVNVAPLLSTGSSPWRVFVANSNFSPVTSSNCVPPVQLGPRPLTWGFLNNSLLNPMIISLAMCLGMPAGGAEELEVRASAAAAVAGAAWPAEDCPIKEDS